MRSSVKLLTILNLLFAVSWSNILTAQITTDFYENNEVIIPFDTLETEEFNQPLTYGEFTYHTKVRFCVTSSYEGQGLISKDPFQCYLFICKRSVFAFKRRKAIKGYNVELSAYDEPDREAFEFEKLKINGQKVLKWRYTYGKTRLDHYLVGGRKMIYLFVSSPFGSNGNIENIIRSMEWK